MVWFIDVSPALLVFLGLSLAGTVFVITSVSVIGVWFGLECNFFGFIPLLNGKTTEESEGAMKYFIIQGLGSSFIFAGVCLMMSEGWKGDGPLFSFMGAFMFLIGMMIKVGLFPFHFWFPSIMGGSSWFNCFMLSTWQKLGVFFVVSGMSMTSSVSGLIIMSALATSIIGGAGGVGQVYFRSILAYSSLVHSGWMTIVCLISEVAFLCYYFIYMMIVFFLFRMVSHFQKGSLSIFSESGMMGVSYIWVWVLVSILSLGGLPPLLGSSIKLLGIMVSFPAMKGGLLVLLLSSVVGLFYYLSVVFSSSLSYSGLLNSLNLNLQGKVHLMKSSFWSFILNTVVGVVVFFSVGSLLL